MMIISFRLYLLILVVKAYHKNFLKRRWAHMFMTSLEIMFIGGLRHANIDG
jgi:hypothetical protein